MNSESLYACFLLAISRTWWMKTAAINKKYPNDVAGVIKQNAAINGITDNNERVFGFASALQH